jgi:hypothetical protein
MKSQIGSGVSKHGAKVFTLQPLEGLDQPINELWERRHFGDFDMSLLGPQGRSIRCLPPCPD